MFLHVLIDIYILVKGLVTFVWYGHIQPT